MGREIRSVAGFSHPRVAACGLGGFREFAQVPYHFWTQGTLLSFNFQHDRVPCHVDQRPQLRIVHSTPPSSPAVRVPFPARFERAEVAVAKAVVFFVERDEDPGDVVSYERRCCEQRQRASIG